MNLDGDDFTLNFNACDDTANILSFFETKTKSTSNKVAAAAITIAEVVKLEKGNKKEVKTKLINRNEQVKLIDSQISDFEAVGSKDESKKKRKTVSVLPSSTEAIDAPGNDQSHSLIEASHGEDILSTTPLTIANESITSSAVVIPTKKFKSLTKKEDPMQFHAKPKDLSVNALAEPRQVQPSSQRIFTKNLFSSLPLDKRIVELLERSRQEGGFDLKTATRVQSAVIPTLMKKQNM